MPKRILAIAFAVGALALAACNNGDINNLYGTATPTPGPTPTVTPNPSASTAYVSVSYSASPLPNQPVNVSTADPSGHAGATIGTQNTDSTGKATFSNLTPALDYCFSSTFTPPVNGALARTISQCGTLWGTGAATTYIQF